MPPKTTPRATSDFRADGDRHWLYFLAKDPDSISRIQVHAPAFVRAGEGLSDHPRRLAPALLAAPYAKRLKQRVTIRLDDRTVAYFKALASETALPYETLINHYLRDCAESKRHSGWTGGPQAKSVR